MITGNNHWYWGRKDVFILRALETGKYFVDVTGEVINLDYRGRGVAMPLKTRADRWGYTIVHLFDGEKRMPVLLHRVVALTYLERKDGDYQVNHLDGCKSNCAASNLEWTTPGANARHAYATGLRHVTVPNHVKFQPGEAHHSAKLDRCQVDAIRRSLVAGESQRSLATRFGVGQPTISAIARGKTWRRIDEEGA